MTTALWKDSDFPADCSVLADIHADATDIVWKRPRELCADPKFIVDGATRLDINQGQIGDCWFLAATTCALKYGDKFQRCVPPEQSFDVGYTGKFRFKFWNAGEWQEVCVDDRLPTQQDQLLYGQNATQTNEFWLPLLEKAYAKFFGGYQQIDGGFESTAMVHFTGGFSESFDLGLPDVIPDIDHEALWRLMRDAVVRLSMITCSACSNTDEGEVLCDNGLLYGHAYGITDMRELQVNGTRTRFIRIRNPWGYVEWKGKWSDGSAEWNQISAVEKQNVGLSVQDDGEFWMEFGDFLSFFTGLEFCHVPPEDTTDSSLWTMTSFSDVIPEDQTSGFNTHTFDVAPVVDGEGNPVDKVHVIVSLLQTSIVQDADIQQIVFDLRTDDCDTSLTPVDIKTSRSCGREMTRHFLLPVGQYVIKLGRDSDETPAAPYLLRILTETGVSDQYLKVR